MDPAIVKVNERQKSVALESITQSRDAVAWRLDNESKYLAEYKQQYENQQAKVDKLLDELLILNDLIAAFGGITSSTEDSPANSETTNQQSNSAQGGSKEVVGVELAEPHRRIQYPSSPKEKLKELVLSGTQFKTDEELHSELERAFNINDIPRKTVVNYLTELRKENVIKRYKSVAHGTFLSGRLTWVNDEGIPLKEYWPEP